MSRSETLRSLASSSTGRKGLNCSVGDIQLSCHIFVFKPFPMTFPRFWTSKSRPYMTLLQPCEHDAAGSILRKAPLWQYFPVRILASRHEGSVMILHANFASNA